MHGAQVPWDPAESSLALRVSLDMTPQAPRWKGLNGMSWNGWSLKFEICISYSNIFKESDINRFSTTVVPLPAIWFTASAGRCGRPGMEVALEETKRLIHDGHAAILKAALP